MRQTSAASVLAFLAFSSLLGRALCRRQSVSKQKFAVASSVSKQKIAVASTEHTILVVRSSFRDYSAVEADVILDHIEQLKKFLFDESFGTFTPEVTFEDVFMDENWADTAKNTYDIRDRILERVGGESYTYRAVYFPKKYSRRCGAAAGTVNPSLPPSNGRVWTHIFCARPEVLIHEIGHNFGLGHSGALENGRWYKYRDYTTVMGGGFEHFTVPDRFKVGWMDDEDVAVPVPGKKYSLMPLEGYKKGTGAGLRFPCEACESLAPRVRPGGDIYVSFAKDLGKAHGRSTWTEQWENKVFVHYDRTNRSSATEVWAKLRAGEEWQNPYGAQAVHVCSLEDQKVSVGFASTLEDAKAACTDAPAPVEAPAPESAEDVEGSPDDEESDVESGEDDEESG